MRRLHHAGLLVRPDAGISDPKDLEGKNVGVRAYPSTTGVWTRFILMDEYGAPACPGIPAPTSLTLGSQMAQPEIGNHPMAEGCFASGITSICMKG